MTSIMFLRRILALDAASCVALGLLTSLGASILSPRLGLAEPLLLWAGLLLLPTAAFIGWLASRTAPPRPLVWLVILGNLGWTAESFLMIAQQAGRITPLGGAFVAGQALAVLAVAILEYGALRKSSTAAAA